MMFWRKKNKDKEPEETSVRIEFRSDDDPMDRARNIWYALGFVNDRMGAIPQIAAYLHMYQDWDKGIRK